MSIININASRSIGRKLRLAVVVGSIAVGAALAVIAPPALADAYTDFFRAVGNDNADEVASLLRRGFDSNAIEAKRGETGLMQAIQGGSKKVIEVLLNARDIDFEARAFNGNTALMLAAYKGLPQVVQTLLDKGVEVNQPGWTALHYAATAGNNEIVQLLLDKSAYIDAESPNGTTPMMMAARSGHILTVKLLLDEGADATMKNQQGMSAIDFALKFGHKDIAEGLQYRLEKSGKR
ncbi:ankyrin repeat domain-containing protein [Herminiimonas sp. CN]|uniref:ankyrin repeat domain-containing protein n=1 Tax=Herminiimonas sp. CN TaxID=1349818 RepID=UPI0009E039CE|nr:ankyrin repeat domain-containing protein [Herminiimonas sp. CN]